MSKKISDLIQETSLVSTDDLVIARDGENYRVSPPVFGGGFGIKVAASNALDKSRAVADYLCDGVDDQVEINNAISNLPSTGGTVELSEGVFECSGALVIPSNKCLRLIGHSLPMRDYTEAATRLNFTFSSTGNIITMSGLVAQSLENLALYGDGINTDKAIYLDNATYKQIRNVAIYNVANRGLHLVNGVSQCLFEFVYVRDLDFHGFESATNTTANTYIHCEVTRSAAMGISPIYRAFTMRDVASIFINCVAERYNRGYHVASYAYGNAFLDCYGEVNNSTFFIEGTAGGPVEATVIMGGVCSNDAQTSVQLPNNAKGTTIIGLHIGGASSVQGYYLGNNNVEDTTIIGGANEAPTKIAGTGDRLKVFGVNSWVTENRGAEAGVSDGGTINHGLASTPAIVVATPTVAGEMVSVTGKNATNFTVAIKQDDGTPGTAQTIYWHAWF